MGRGELRAGVGKGKATKRRGPREGLLSITLQQTGCFIHLLGMKGPTRALPD